MQDETVTFFFSSGQEDGLAGRGNQGHHHVLGKTKGASCNTRRTFMFVHLTESPRFIVFVHGTRLPLIALTTWPGDLAVPIPSPNASVTSNTGGALSDTPSNSPTISAEGACGNTIRLQQRRGFGWKGCRHGWSGVDSNKARRRAVRVRQLPR